MGMTRLVNTNPGHCLTRAWLSNLALGQAFGLAGEAPYVALRAGRVCHFARGYDKQELPPQRSRYTGFTTSRTGQFVSFPWAGVVYHF